MPFVVFKFIILALNSIKVFGVGHISYLWQVFLSCGTLYVGSYLEILNYLNCCFELNICCGRRELVVADMNNLSQMLAVTGVS